jgi:hypothetical protein
MGLSAEGTMPEKLILPAELKVCATCSYWDGERRVDGELKLVVVDECCEGQCLVTETIKPSLHPMQAERACLWEDLEPDSDTKVA